MILFAEPCTRARRIFSWRQIAVSGWPLLHLAKAPWRDLQALKFQQKVTLLSSDFGTLEVSSWTWQLKKWCDDHMIEVVSIC